MWRHLQQEGSEVSDYRADISPCGKFRYELEYSLGGSGPVASVLMVNPSTADGVKKDATIRKLDGFGSRLGWSRYIVGNKFAYRATDVKEVGLTDDPDGPLNYEYLLLIMLKTDVTVVAWGSLAKLPLRLRSKWRRVVSMAQSMNRPLYCWGRCEDGQPKHPVMLGYDTPLIKWEPPL